MRDSRGRSETREQTRSSRLPPAFLARLFVMAMSPCFPQCALAVQLLFQPPQCLLHRLTFFQSDFRQFRFTPLSYAFHPEVIRQGMKTLSVQQCDAHHSRHATACQTFRSRVQIRSYGAGGDGGHRPPLQGGRRNGRRARRPPHYGDRREPRMRFAATRRARERVSRLQEDLHVAARKRGPPS